MQVSASRHPVSSPECHGLLGLINGDRINGDHSVHFPTLLNCILRNIDNHMANWKVVALVSGNIEAVSGSAAQNRPELHEWTVWEGSAPDKAEALQCAEKADPRVDLEWMRIRYEPDLSAR